MQKNAIANVSARTSRKERSQSGPVATSRATPIALASGPMRHSNAAKAISARSPNAPHSRRACT
jgi:hypothetical protein